MMGMAETAATEARAAKAVTETLVWRDGSNRSNGTKAALSARVAMETMALRAGTPAMAVTVMAGRAATATTVCDDGEGSTGGGHGKGRNGSDHSNFGA